MPGQYTELMMASDSAPDFTVDPCALRKACKDDAVFDDWTEPDYRAIANELGALPEYTLLRVEDDAYQSGGWASFVEIQLARRGIEPEIQNGYRVTQYASVTLCRIAPLAAFMKVSDEWRVLDGTNRSTALPCVDDMTADFPWDERRRVPDVLARHGYRVLSPEVGQRTMPDGLAADTLLGGRDEDESDVAHTIFDAWFHWMD